MFTVNHRENLGATLCLCVSVVQFYFKLGHYPLTRFRYTLTILSYFCRHCELAAQCKMLQ